MKKVWFGIVIMCVSALTLNAYQDNSKVVDTFNTIRDNKPVSIKAKEDGRILFLIDSIPVLLDNRDLAFMRKILDNNLNFANTVIAGTTIYFAGNSGVIQTVSPKEGRIIFFAKSNNSGGEDSVTIQMDVIAKKFGDGTWKCYTVYFTVAEIKKLLVDFDSAEAWIQNIKSQKLQLKSSITQ